MVGATRLTILGISMGRTGTVSSRKVDFTVAVSEAVPVCMEEAIGKDAFCEKARDIAGLLTNGRCRDCRTLVGTVVLKVC
jgi:hypothetical protein